MNLGDLIIEAKDPLPNAEVIFVTDVKEFINKSIFIVASNQSIAWKIREDYKGSRKYS